MQDPACGEWLLRAHQGLPILHAVSHGRRALMRAAAGEGGEGGADLELAKILESQCSSLTLYTKSRLK